VIFDTQFLGELSKKESDPNAVELAEDIDARDYPQRVPAAVVWEVFHGLGRMGSQPTEIRTRYEMLFEGTSTIPFDDSTARRAGTLRGKHGASDRLANLDGADSIVAAHGLALGEPVVSNDSDFGDVEGLEVVSY
jgi:predicted nucleic acid-binding protein